MTREEAIEVLQKSTDNTIEMTIREWEEFDKEVAEAIDMAIEALQSTMSQERVNHESTNAVGVGRYENAMQKLREMSKCLNGVKEKQITKISADAVQGKWVRKYDDKVNCYWYECDQCGEYRPRNQFGHEYNANFCPNCGAKMDGERKEP